MAAVEATTNPTTAAAVRPTLRTGYSPPSGRQGRPQREGPWPSFLWLADSSVASSGLHVWLRGGRCRCHHLVALVDTCKPGAALPNSWFPATGGSCWKEHRPAVGREARPHLCWLPRAFRRRISSVPMMRARTFDSANSELRGDQIACAPVPPASQCQDYTPFFAPSSHGHVTLPLNDNPPRRALPRVKNPSPASARTQKK